MATPSSAFLHRKQKERGENALIAELEDEGEAIGRRERERELYLDGKKRK